MKDSIRERPEISIIVPVYNVVNYLEQCIQSILEQEFKDIEIVIVDDGSNDGSSELCDRLKDNDRRIKVIHQSNKGLSGARNTGIENCSGNYIGFIDSDDWIAKDFYKHLISIAKSTGAELVSCLYRRTSNRKQCNVKQRKENVCVYNSRDALELFLKSALIGKDTYVPCWSKIYKSDLINDIRFKEGVIYEDYPFNYDVISKCNKVAFTNRIGYFYYRNNQSITGVNVTKKMKDLYTVMDYVENEYDEGDSEIRCLIKQNRAKVDLSILFKSLLYGSNDEEMVINSIEGIKNNYSLLVKAPIGIHRRIVLTLLGWLPTEMIRKISLRKIHISDRKYNR